MVDLGRALGWSGRPFGDDRPWTTGSVAAVDTAGGRLEVLVDGARSVLPRVDGDYRPGDTVLILRDPDATGSGQLVVGTLGAVRTPAVPPSMGTVSSVGSSSVTVSTTAGALTCASITSAVLAVGDTVLILRDAAGGPWVVGKVGVTPTAPATPGAPTLTRADSIVTASWAAAARASSYLVRWALGSGGWGDPVPYEGLAFLLSIGVGGTLTVQVAAVNAAGQSAWSASSSITYAAPAPTTRQEQVVIRPTWSGSYRASSGQWDRWNTDRYGGRSTLYQGSGRGSGTMRGLATYGTQLRDLGAISIDAITVTMPGAGLAETPVTIVVQGSPDGSQPGGAPSSSGETASGGQSSTGATAWASLPPSIREDFRTGAVQGLALVGSDYGAVLGTAAADGMALTVTYTRYV